MGGEGAADLAGPEHDVQLTLVHERILADSEQPGRRRQSDLDACGPRYAGSKKLAINFLKTGPPPVSCPTRETSVAKNIGGKKQNA